MSITFGQLLYNLDEATKKVSPQKKNVKHLGRTRIIGLRVQHGKVQRRKQFSDSKGFTIRDGRVVRMTAQELRNRKAGARKAKIKNRTKQSQIVRNRKFSLRKRHGIGL